jgi:type II secretory pathway component PulJ
MASERLDMAIKNFEHMNQMVERYTRLSRAYVRLSERFHQLDVEHMKLKGQVVPLIKVARDYKARLQSLEAENASLEKLLQEQTQQYRQELQTLTKTYEDKLQSLSQHLDELKPLENLLSQEAYQSLAEAEEQIELDEATFQEMDEDSSPDLLLEEKALLTAYQENPEEFLPPAPEDNGHASPPHSTQNGASDSGLWAYEFDERPMVEQTE